MGCAETRESTEEQGINTYERMLKFHHLTIPEIKQAFFQVNSSGTISKIHLEYVFEELGFSYSCEGKDAMDRFLSAFFLFEENNVEHYDLIQLLSILYLLSKSSQKEKANSLFDLFDEKGARELTRIQFETEIDRLIEVVFLYSEKLLDNDNGMIQLHREITQEKKQKIMPNIYQKFFKGRKTISKEYFIKIIQQSSMPDNQENLVDFTDLVSIRAKLMDYVLAPAQSQIQLQSKYKFRTSSRLSHIFSEDQYHNALTQANSLLASPTRKSFNIKLNKSSL